MKVRFQNDPRDKNTAAYDIAGRYCLLSKQVLALCNELPMYNRLDFAKSCYQNCLDPDNFDLVFNAFADSKQVDALYDYIEKNFRAQPKYNGYLYNNDNDGGGHHPHHGDYGHDHDNGNTVVAPPPPPPVYVPGYNGAIGCAIPMTENDFREAKRTIGNSSFEDTKFNTAKTIFGQNCLTVTQVTEICGMFSFEETKLKFAKFAYSKTYDKGNYFKVGNIFTFDASRNELDNFIQNGGR
jgi:hypothetical protein